MKNQHVQTIPPTQAERVRERLAQLGFEIDPRRTPPHAQFQAVGKNARLTIYRSGKLLIQGAATEELVELLAPLLASEAPPGPLDGAGSTIGSDESGKGDYFGSLVVASCFLDAEQAAWARKLGVRDSKEATPQQVDEISREIARRVPHHVVEIEPEEYNRLHAECRNVNVLLAAAHARAITKLLEAHQPQRIIVDRFASDRLVRDALGSAAKGIELIQVPRAEANTAVAAASFLARARFVESLERLSAIAGTTLLPGASAAVDRRAREIVRRNGADVLRRIAKVHFRTTARVLD